MHNCGYEMEFYDGGDYVGAQATYSCTGCDHVCFVDSDTGEIDCECMYEQPLENAVADDFNSSAPQMGTVSLRG
jgi:hypothetical protein